MAVVRLGVPAPVPNLRAGTGPPEELSRPRIRIRQC